MTSKIQKFVDDNAIATANDQRETEGHSSVENTAIETGTGDSQHDS